MLQIVPLTTFLWVYVSCAADDFYQFPYNATRSTVSGIAAYRSALTLDWLAGEDSRQRELVNAFETEGTPRPRARNTECIAYSRPASGKIARLMLELLKNLEGDEGVIIPELIQALVRSKLLVETSALDAEPDLEALVHTPGAMLGEPHATFPRVLALVWAVAADPVTTKKSGWCAVTKLNQYLMLARPVDIAKQMRALDPIVARVRFVMEEFIQHVTPLNIYPDAPPTPAPAPPALPAPPKLKNSKKKKLKPINRESRGEPAMDGVAGGGGVQPEYGAEAPPPEPLHDPLRSALEPAEDPEPYPPYQHQEPYRPLRAQPEPASAAGRATPAAVFIVCAALI